MAEAHEIMWTYTLFLLSLLRMVGSPKDPCFAKLSRISGEMGAYDTHMWPERG